MLLKVTRLTPVVSKHFSLKDTLYLTVLATTDRDNEEQARCADARGMTVALKLCAGGNVQVVLQLTTGVVCKLQSLAS